MQPKIKDTLLIFLVDLSRTLKRDDPCVSCCYAVDSKSEKSVLYISTNNLSKNPHSNSKILQSIEKVLDNLKNRIFKGEKTIANYLPFIKTLMQSINSSSHNTVFDTKKVEHQEFLLWYFKDIDPYNMRSLYGFDEHSLSEKVTQMIWKYVNGFNRLIICPHFDEIIDSLHEIISLDDPGVHSEIKLLSVWIKNTEFRLNNIEGYLEKQSQGLFKATNIANSITSQESNLNPPLQTIRIGTSKRTCVVCESLFKEVENLTNLKILRRPTHEQSFKYHNKQRKELVPEIISFLPDLKPVFDTVNINKKTKHFELESKTDAKFKKELEFSDFEGPDVPIFGKLQTNMADYSNAFPEFDAHLVNSLSDDKKRIFVGSLDDNSKKILSSILKSEEKQQNSLI